MSLVHEIEGFTFLEGFPARIQPGGKMIYETFLLLTKDNIKILSVIDPSKLLPLFEKSEIEATRIWAEEMEGK
jgi:hypothetical protein